MVYVNYISIGTKAKMDFVTKEKGEPMNILNEILRWCEWSQTYRNMWLEIISEALAERREDGAVVIETNTVSTEQ